MNAELPVELKSEILTYSEIIKDRGIPLIIDMDQLAAFFNTTYATVRYTVAHSDIPKQKIGQKYMFSTIAVLRWMDTKNTKKLKVV